MNTKQLFQFFQTTKPLSILKMQNFVGAYRVLIQSVQDKKTERSSEGRGNAYSLLVFST
ncbi:hypothetical protein NIES4073_50240 [Kalymmatonema gypsitolerans NIES-4073]|nr:hypothetical protein NIES4073_50240 [Scytonema sp. NIES-4073]